MATCQLPGHPDSYGLGIRIAFYVQWFGIIVTSWILPSDSLNLVLLNGLTTAATAIGLAINIGDLEPVEILVVLILVCGALYLWVPVYLWRFCTCCRQWWDPEPWNRVKPGTLLKMGLFLMYGALLCLQLWFWTTGVHNQPSTASSSSSFAGSCHQYGFLFAPVQLDSALLITFNIGIHFIMLVVGTWVFASWVGLFDECRWYRYRKKEKWRTTPSRIETLRELRGISDIIVASVVTTAVELIVSWNNITNVNNLDTAAQLIPTAISTAYLFRGFYVWVSEPSPHEIDPYTSGANTIASGSHYWGRRSQGAAAAAAAGGGGGGGGGGERGYWTREKKRTSHRSSRHYDDGQYMPAMMTAAAATPSVPYATYTQQYRPATVADEPGT